MPEEVAVPVIRNTIESLEWKEEEQNENRFNRAVQISNLSVDVAVSAGVDV